MTRISVVMFAWACVFWGAVLVAAEPPQPPAANVQAQFAEFLKAPTRENFLRVQKSVMSDPSYAPYSPDLEEIADLLDQQKFQEARTKLAAAGANLLLSPRAHLFAARAAKGLGDQPAQKAETAIAQKCLQGLLSTGEGTPASPIAVSRVSDEYDVTRHLKKRVMGQGLRGKEGRSYDVLRLTDGSEMWFDITVPLRTKFK